MYTCEILFLMTSYDFENISQKRIRIPGTCKREFFVTLVNAECDGTWTHNHLVPKWTLKPNWPVWLNGWVFVYKLSGCGFESCCSHLNFRHRVYFECGLWIECGLTLKRVRDMIRTYNYLTASSFQPLTNVTKSTAMIKKR